jgi:hypothetical protein
MSVFTGCLPEKTGVFGNVAFWEAPLRRKVLEHFRDEGHYYFGAGKVLHGTFDFATAGRTRATRRGLGATARTTFVSGMPSRLMPWNHAAFVSSEQNARLR